MKRNRQQVIDAANLVVAEYVLREDFAKQHAADVCGCPSCILQYEQALDRRDWALLIQKWQLSGSIKNCNSLEEMMEAEDDLPDC